MVWSGTMFFCEKLLRKKGLELTLSVETACGNCLLELNMQSKEVSNQSIIRLKERIADLPKRSLGMVKSTIWYILKNKECTGELSNAKSSRNHGRQLNQMIIALHLAKSRARLRR